MPDRLDALQQWLGQCLGDTCFTLEPASGDASFRRYFRITHGAESFIAMDAPPEREDSRPYVAVAAMLAGLGLHVPAILQQDLDQGFLLLTDMGDRLYLDALDADSVERLYGDALGALITLQAYGPREKELPPYDRAMLLREMELFRHWLVGEHLGLVLTDAQQAMLTDSFDALADAALAQPQVCVHRDYHSRNLMCTAGNNPGILDFQDAVIGPLTYDLVSLLRDCYIAWPRAQVEGWALGYRELAVQSGVLRPDEIDEAGFLRWFDWMGVQRHLKAAGIFARLNHRDGKRGYLADIPRTLGYITEVAADYAPLRPLGAFVESAVLPRLA